jgi:DNA invertase Pin-like site-specific DNA recombinase
VIFYYARVSTDEQDMQLQIDDALLNKVPTDNIICEQASGKNMDQRPLFLDLVYNVLQPGDTLMFWKIDRIGRSVKDLTNVLHDLNARGILYRCTTQPIIDSTKSDSLSKLMIGMLTIFAEFERNLTSDRTKAGMAAAAGRGVKLGRPRKVA